jgi:endoglucanase
MAKADRRDIFMDELFPLIKELSEIVAPSGQEAAINERIASLWKDAGTKVKQTRIGNVIGHVGGKGKKLLIAAHGDELTYLVRSIDANGFVFLANGQGWQRTLSMRDAFMIGQRVTLLARSGHIDGFIAAPTGHIANMSLTEPKEMTWNDVWVETGLSRDELFARGVTTGTRVVWKTTTERLGDQISGKALDDRASLAVMTELVRRVQKKKLKWDLTLACTVQEEIGLVGASAVASRERFDAVIIVEIGLAGDVPNVGASAMPVKLGAGPILVHKDSGTHYDHNLTRKLEKCANEADISIQHAVFSYFGSDGRMFMQSDVPTAMICFPARYTHSPFETAHFGDLKAMVDWLEAFIT